MLCAMESSLFDDVGDALRGILPPELGTLQMRAHRYGIKVWFGTGPATKGKGAITLNNKVFTLKA